MNRGRIAADPSHNTSASGAAIYDASSRSNLVPRTFETHQSVISQPFARDNEHGVYSHYYLKRVGEPSMRVRTSKVLKASGNESPLE